MKKSFKMIMGGLIVFFLSTSTIYAIPATLYDILGYAGTAKYTDTGAESAYLTDTDGINDDSTFFLYLESAGYATTNCFGIYGYTVNADNTITIGDKLQVFSGSDSAIGSATISFNVAAGTATIDGTTANIGTLFGFYLTTQDKQTYYSTTSLNADSFDHFMIFDTSDNSVGKLLGADVVIGMEDLFGGGDQDFNDMVVGVSDVTPVPEPATLILLGSGLLGLAGFKKRQLK